MPFPLPMQNYRSLDFITAVLPDANEDKPVTADSEVISLPAPGSPVFCFEQWLCCIVDGRPQAESRLTQLQAGLPACLPAKLFQMILAGFIRQVLSALEEGATSGKCLKRGEERSSEFKGSQDQFAPTDSRRKAVHTPPKSLSCAPHFHTVVKNHPAHPQAQASA